MAIWLADRAENQTGTATTSKGMQPSFFMFGNVTQVAHWLAERAVRVEHMTGMLDLAISLLQLAQQTHPLEGLGPQLGLFQSFQEALQGAPHVTHSPIQSQSFAAVPLHMFTCIYAS